LSLPGELSQMMFARYTRTFDRNIAARSFSNRDMRVLFELTKVLTLQFRPEEICFVQSCTKWRIVMNQHGRGINGQLSRSALISHSHPWIGKQYQKQLLDEIRVHISSWDNAIFRFTGQMFVQLLAQKDQKRKSGSIFPVISSQPLHFLTYLYNYTNIKPHHLFNRPEFFV
jgi:hypothetical protein